MREDDSGRPCDSTEWYGERFPHEWRMLKECLVLVEGGTSGAMPVKRGRAGAVATRAALKVSGMVLSCNNKGKRTHSDPVGVGPAYPRLFHQPIYPQDIENGKGE